MIKNLNAYSALRPKYLLFGIIAMMMFVVIRKDLVLFNPPAELVQHYRPFKWWLVPHGIAGALVLILGPLQFSKRLRQRHLGWHRIAGRTYVACVFVAAPLGILIEYVKYLYSGGSMRLVLASTGLGCLFVTTTALAFLKAKQKKIQEHRKWMTRSYAIALIFLETRCVDQIPWLTRIFDWPSRVFEAHSVSDMWMYILLAPVFAELVLRCEQMLNDRSSRNRMKSVAAV